MKKNFKKIFFLAVLVAFGVLGRLLPHAWNTTPMTAIALFASAYLGFEYSMVFVFAAMFISDGIIGFYSWPIMISVYASLFVASLLGQYIKKHKNVGSIAVVTFGSSILFFLVTNWAVWQFGTMYLHSWAGLMQSYTMAVPFFRNSLVGDLFYTGAIFGVYEAICYAVGKYQTRKFVRPEGLEPPTLSV